MTCWWCGAAATWQSARDPSMATCDQHTATGKQRKIAPPDSFGSARERNRLYARWRRSDPERGARVRDRENARRRQRYAEDPEYRARENERARRQRRRRKIDGAPP